MLILFFNFFLALLWIILFESSSLSAFIAGFAVAFGLLSVLEPRYGRRGYFFVRFAVSVLWQVTVSSMQVAWVIVQPKLKVTPGIIALPLDVSQEFEIAALASAITLTPGTLSVDLGQDRSNGERVLFVHALFTDDAQGTCRQIKQGFERDILEISRGEVQDAIHDGEEKAS